MFLTSSILFYLLFGLTLGSSIWIWSEQKCARRVRRERQAHDDIFQQVLAEAQLARDEAAAALENAKKANLAKSDFLANTSHEIRTPMNAILGMTRLIIDSPLTDEQRSWAQMVYDSGESLLSIINDILDLSKIEADRLSLVRDTFDLYRAMSDVVDLVVQKAEQKNIALIVDIDTNVPRYILGDSMRIKQIVLNFLSNAVKFTATGHVKLAISYDPSQPNSELLLFSVSDTGIGIPADKLNYVFDKFTQAEESTTRRFGGTGLGLAISKKLVGLMDGTIGVESVLQQGSRFWFSIPCPKRQANPHHIPSYDLKGKRLLVLSDNPANVVIITHLAHHKGMQIEVCTVVDHALDNLRVASDREERFDVLLIDHGFNGVKILELIERIRIFPVLDNLRFIAIAALGSASATRFVNSKMFDALLSYPLFTDQLEDALRIIMKARDDGVKSGLVTRALIEKLYNANESLHDQVPVFQGAKILVVEDMNVNQVLMGKILQKLGCISEQAMNGREALSKVTQNDYDLIFMDGHMPELDGFETTREIRALEKTSARHSIIVALTADAMSGDEEKYLNAGMNDYLNKPVTQERIAGMLKKWVARV